LAGYRNIRRAIHDWSIDVVMPRSTLPALSTLLALRSRPMRMVFDADGLPLDERVDFHGQSPSGLVYRFLRDVEAQAVRRADVILTRSSKAVDILHARAGAGTLIERFYTVGNGRDANSFTLMDIPSRQAVRADLGVGEEAPLLVYAGSLGGKYRLFEMLELFSLVLARRPDAKLLILTGSPDIVTVELSRFQHIESSVTVLTVGPDEVAAYLASSDLGLALIEQSFSMQAAAAIKVGEYLLCGLPVVATTGIGDSAALPNEVGFLIDDLDTDSIKRAATWFVEIVLPQREVLRERCREVGLSLFSLETSVDSYREAFQRLSE
jgi:glycosyltransferase involved in cell wall biosynthesis